MTFLILFPSFSCQSIFLGKYLTIARGEMCLIVLKYADQPGAYITLESPEEERLTLFTEWKSALIKSNLSCTRQGLRSSHSSLNVRVLNPYVYHIDISLIYISSCKLAYFLAQTCLHSWSGQRSRMCLVLRYCENTNQTRSDFPVFAPKCMDIVEFNAQAKIVSIMYIQVVNHKIKQMWDILGKIESLMYQFLFLPGCNV